MMPRDDGMEDKTAVLMMTCYKFRQTWEPFFTLLKKYWNDCPYEVVMGTDKGNYKGVRVVEVGEDLGWASNCIYVLNQLSVDKVVLLLDDYFIYEPVNGDRVRKLVRHARDHSIGCLRLTPCPGPTGPWKGTESLGIIKPGDQYRLSLQSAIWDKQVLLGLLKPGESAWDTEVAGSRRSVSVKKPFVSVWRGQAPLKYTIGVLKGKWRKEALELLKKENIPTEGINRIVRR